MIQGGLVSITFRKLTPKEVVDLVSRSGLVGIEWGGDIHVPHGDLAAAGEARRMTEDAGLQVAAYGSYYKIGRDELEKFPAVLDTAVELGATKIRVWVGDASAKVDEAYRKQAADDCRQIAAMAAEANVEIVSEWHTNTLTDTNDSSKALFDAIGHENFRTYWQPIGTTFEENMAGLDVAFDRLSGLHVYHWANGQKLALAEGKDLWLPYLARAAQAGDMFALLEFVRDDNPAAFLEDAKTLRQWLDETNQK